MVKTTPSRPPAPLWTYAIALGSNRALRRGVGPRAIVAAALAALDQAPFALLAASPIISSRPVGPSRRTYANAAAMVSAALSPLAALDALHMIERRFNRRRARRWGERTLDLDIIFWSGGRVARRRLTIPHAAYRSRTFVLAPLKAIAPTLRDPRDGLTVAALSARLRKARPVDRSRPRH